MSSYTEVARSDVLILSSIRALGAIDLAVVIMTKTVVIIVSFAIC